jgi:7-cyano-7-deazaguanine reductase
VSIAYRPDELCLESKSLKLYLWSFREEACFAETLAARILEDIMQATRALYGRVDLKQNVRGGIELTVVAEMTRD